MINLSSAAEAASKFSNSNPQEFNLSSAISDPMSAIKQIPGLVMDGVEHLKDRFDGPGKIDFNDPNIKDGDWGNHRNDFPSSGKDLPKLGDLDLGPDRGTDCFPRPDMESVTSTPDLGKLKEAMEGFGQNRDGLGEFKTAIGGM